MPKECAICKGPDELRNAVEAAILSGESGDKLAERLNANGKLAGFSRARIYAHRCKCMGLKGFFLHAAALKFHQRKMKSTNAPRTGRLIVQWPEVWPGGISLSEHAFTIAGEPFDAADRRAGDDVLKIVFEKVEQFRNPCAAIAGAFDEASEENAARAAIG